MLLHCTLFHSISKRFDYNTTIHILSGSNCYLSGNSSSHTNSVHRLIFRPFTSIVPISIIGAYRFYDTIGNLLGIIGYWPTAYVSIVLIEHLYFRKNDLSLYDVTAWNIPKHLPSGVPAVATIVLSMGVVIPFMDQAWFTGKVARTTGDIRFEVAFVVGGSLYFLFRSIEVSWRGRFI